MINHPAHIENARRALRYFDDSPTGAEIGRRGVMVASALRVLLYEPADEYQGGFLIHGKPVARDYLNPGTGEHNPRTCEQCAT